MPAVAPQLGLGIALRSLSLPHEALRADLAVKILVVTEAGQGKIKWNSLSSGPISVTSSI